MRAGEISHNALFVLHKNADPAHTHTHTRGCTLLTTKLSTNAKVNTHEVKLQQNTMPDLKKIHMEHRVTLYLWILFVYLPFETSFHLSPI